MKRIFDIICSACGLLVLSPFLILVACMIKVGDGGPVLYRGVRVGLNGKLFRISKFRTMIVNADKIGGASTADDDSRITKIGRFLRKWKLDELPQLINVFKGEISFVGPRPEVKHYVDMFSKEERAILSVLPGITDWASLWNPDEGAVLAGSADPEETYMEKVRPTKLKLQLKYVKEHSFLTDIKIIFQTLIAVAIRRG
ncbi:MAG: sugar transferase [Candidatus Omnitrophica bacterium]|nr:sugar transferase [Candidatus Omnitrophota bacterium]